MLEKVGTCVKAMGETVGVAASDVAFKLGKNAPRIFVGIGLATMVVGAGYMAKQTLKLEDALDESKKDIEASKKANDKNGTRRAYGRVAARMAKLYGVPVAMLTAGACSVLYGTKMLNKRMLAAEAMIIVGEENFRRYRDLTVKEVGAEKEAEIALDAHHEVIRDEEGNEKIVLKPNDNCEPCIVTYDWNEDTVRESYFDNNPWNNILAMQAGVHHTVSKYKARGYIWANDLLTMMGVKDDCLEPSGWKHGVFINDCDVHGPYPFTVRIVECNNEDIYKLKIGNVYRMLPNENGKISTNFTIVIDGISYISDEVEKFIESRNKKSNEVMTE